MITIYFPNDIEFELFKYAYDIQTIKFDAKLANSLEEAVEKCETAYLCWTKYIPADDRFVEDNLKICNRNNPVVISKNSIFLYLKKIKKIPNFQFEEDDNSESLEKIKLLKVQDFKLNGHEQLIDIFTKEKLNSYLDLTKDMQIFMSLSKTLHENNKDLKIVKSNVDKQEFLRLKSFLPMSSSLKKYDIALIDDNEGLQIMQHCKYCIILNDNITEKIKRKCEIKAIGNFSILKFKNFKKSCCGNKSVVENPPKAKIKIL